MEWKGQVMMGQPQVMGQPMGLGFFMVIFIGGLALVTFMILWFRRHKQRSRKDK